MKLYLSVSNFLSFLTTKLAFFLKEDKWKKKKVCRKMS